MKIYKCTKGVLPKDDQETPGQISLSCQYRAPIVIPSPYNNINNKDDDIHK